jgi:nucleoid-associated protein YgaU
MTVGLIDFAKNIGAQLLGRDDEAAAVDDLNRNLIFANKLLRHVTAFGLPVTELKIAFADGVATIHGKAKDQATRERVVLAVGNTEGVSRVDDQMTVGIPEPAAALYTVKQGDSLSKIAKQYYGDAQKYPVIFDANKPMLKDPNLIYPGQVLRIPASAR